MATETKAKTIHDNHVVLGISPDSLRKIGLGDGLPDDIVGGQCSLGIIASNRDLIRAAQRWITMGKPDPKEYCDYLVDMIDKMKSVQDDNETYLKEIGDLKRAKCKAEEELTEARGELTTLSCGFNIQFGDLKKVKAQLSGEMGKIESLEVEKNNAIFDRKLKDADLIKERGKNGTFTATVDSLNDRIKKIEWSLDEQKATVKQRDSELKRERTKREAIKDWGFWKRVDFLFFPKST